MLESDTSNQMFTFANTVRLRLSFEDLSDLLLLLQSETLPRIEDLHLTVENGLYRSDQSHSGYENQSCLRLSPNDFLNRSESTLVNLRILQLRQMDLINVIVLIEHVKSMSQLQSLILVNCHVQSMNYISRIQWSAKKIAVGIR